MLKFQIIIANNQHHEFSFAARFQLHCRQRYNSWADDKGRKIPDLRRRGIGSALKVLLSPPPFAEDAPGRGNDKKLPDDLQRKK